MSGLAFRVGDRCDQYEVVELIAVGGSGEVYRALQRSMDREVALKCLQFRLVQRSDMKARMQMEGRALGRINHPNVVTVYDAGCTDEGLIWIAMELLVGRTLREVLQERRTLPVQEAVACAIDIAQGVSAAHSKKIIHRDIKPENVFVTQDGIVKVLDLGTAKLQGWGALNTTDRGRVLGTPAYMAPEHIRCTGVDERTDVYAVGLVLYEMLAGHPFARVVPLEDHQAVARCQLHARPQPLSDLVSGVPEPLSRAVHRAMEKDPDDRQQTMDDLAAELRAAAGLPAVVVRVSMRPPATSAPDTGPKVGPHGTVKIAGPESAAQLAPPKRACTTPNGFPPTAGPSPNRAREERRQADGASSAENGVPRGPIGATTHAVPPLFGPKRPAAVPTVPRASLAVAPTLVATARASWPGWKQAVCAAGFGGAVGVPMAIAMLWAMRGSPANPVAEATASSLPSSAAPAVSSAAAIQPIAEGGGDMNASIALAVTPEASAIALPRPERKAGPLAPSSSSVSKTWGRTRAPSAGAPSSKPPAAPSVVDGKRDPTRRIVGGPGRDASAPEPLGEPFF